MEGQDLKQYSTWYIALVIAGVAIATASIAVGDDPALLIGLGFILVGVGEFINHPYQSGIHFDEFGRPLARYSGRPRNPKPLGLMVEILGIILVTIGLFRVVLS